MTDKKQPIGGYAPGNYDGKCTSCGEQFQGDKHALQCESCAIKDKEFYEALTPEQKERFDKRTAEIVKLFFEGRQKDDEIARLRSALETIAYPVSHFQKLAKEQGVTLNGLYASSISNDPNWLKNQATEALKPIIQ